MGINNPQQKFLPDGDPNDLFDKGAGKNFHIDLYNLALDKDVAKKRNLIYLILLVICVCAVVYVSLTANYRTYVVRVDNATGKIEMAGELKTTNYSPREVEIKYFLAWFIRSIRSIPLDPVIYKDNWAKVQYYLTPEAAEKLNALTFQDVKKQKLGKVTNQVEVKSIQLQPTTKSTYQVRWTEEEFSLSGGTVGKKNDYVALLTITTQPPTKEESLRVNPLGIKIIDLNFSKEVLQEGT